MSGAVMGQPQDAPPQPGSWSWEELGSGHQEVRGNGRSERLQYIMACPVTPLADLVLVISMFWIMNLAGGFNHFDYFPKRINR